MKWKINVNYKRDLSERMDLFISLLTVKENNILISMKKNIKDFRKFKKSINPYGMTAFDDMIRKGALCPSNYMTPYIIKEADLHMTQQDVFSELMSKRIIFFGEEFNSDTCNTVIAQLLWLNQQDETSDINIYINSPGGSVTDCFGLLSTMDAISNDVATTSVGLAASCGNLLLVSGKIGKRKALPLAKLLMHQPMGGVKSGTQASDIMIEANFINELKEDICKIYMRQTGLGHDEVWKAMDRDNWIRPENALPGKFGPKGMIDEIITKI